MSEIFYSFFALDFIGTTHMTRRGAAEKGAALHVQLNDF